MTIILFAQHLVFKDVMHICFTIVDLCYLNFCVSLPQWELCYLCQYAVCAVSILTAGLHANASANEQQCEQ